MGIYLDHAATTYTDERVLEAMLPYFKDVFGNASSAHGYGQEAERGVGIARQQVADAIGAKRDEVYFTSGGTESDNWAIKGAAEAAKKGHIVTSAVEHHAVLDTCKYLETRGFDVTYLPADGSGLISADSVAGAIRDDTVLVSIMFANNEVGTLMPIREIGQIARARGVLFHTDAVQAIGHVPIDVDALGIDMLSLSAHKFYGPKGAGALYIRHGTGIAKFMHGGAQEKDMRASTLNTPGIVGLGAAIELAAAEREQNNAHEAVLAKRLRDGLLALPMTKLNGHETSRLPGNVNITFRGIEGEALMIHLDLEGIAVSTGSACTSGSTSPSYVLLAMGLSTVDARAAIRFTVGRGNTAQDIDTVIEKTKNVAERLREISPLFAQYKGDKKYV
ncbi:MAG: cysteine desulfurase NifS [Eubacteriales bacterium]|nr:cysteine desulfurase NifS [Eubacteriales bacterium]